MRKTAVGKAGGRAGVAGPLSPCVRGTQHRVCAHTLCAPAQCVCSTDCCAAPARMAQRTSGELWQEGRGGSAAGAPDARAVHARAQRRTARRGPSEARPCARGRVLQVAARARVACSHARGARVQRACVLDHHVRCVWLGPDARGRPGGQWVKTHGKHAPAVSFLIGACLRLSVAGREGSGVPVCDAPTGTHRVFKNTHDLRLCVSGRGGGRGREGEAAVTPRVVLCAAGTTTHTRPCRRVDTRSPEQAGWPGQASI